MRVGRYQPGGYGDSVMTKVSEVYGGACQTGTDLVGRARQLIEVGLIDGQPQQ